MALKEKQVLTVLTLSSEIPPSAVRVGESLTLPITGTDRPRFAPPSTLTATWNPFGLQHFSKLLQPGWCAEPPCPACAVQVKRFGHADAKLGLTPMTLFLH
jgi:hypothetical protein